MCKLLLSCVLLVVLLSTIIGGHGTINIDTSIVIQGQLEVAHDKYNQMLSVIPVHIEFNEVEEKHQRNLDQITVYPNAEGTYE